KPAPLPEPAPVQEPEPMPEPTFTARPEPIFDEPAREEPPAAPAEPASRNLSLPPDVEAELEMALGLRPGRTAPVEAPAPVADDPQPVAEPEPVEDEPYDPEAALA